MSRRKGLKLEFRYSGVYVAVTIRKKNIQATKKETARKAQPRIEVVIGLQDL
jgi:hypothetical protein